MSRPNKSVNDLTAYFPITGNEKVSCSDSAKEYSLMRLRAGSTSKDLSSMAKYILPVWKQLIDSYVVYHLS